MFLFNKSAINPKFGICDLNTSYVSIQLCRLRAICTKSAEFKYILCFYSIFVFRIHHLKSVSFKYILCFYSIAAGIGIRSDESHLNTSYVSIQCIAGFSIFSTSSNLNTSYVSIQFIFYKTCFRTLLFKYILCFYSMVLLLCEFGQLLLFKYILCFYSMLASCCCETQRAIFKYILCFYSIIKGNYKK